MHQGLVPAQVWQISCPSIFVRVQFGLAVSTVGVAVRQLSPLVHSDERPPGHHTPKGQGYSDTALVWSPLKVACMSSESRVVAGPAFPIMGPHGACGCLALWAAWLRQDALGEGSTEAESTIERISAQLLWGRVGFKQHLKSATVNSARALEGTDHRDV